MHLDLQTGLMAIATLLGGGGAGALIDGWVQRRSRHAQIEAITEKAHEAIYRSYGDLLDDLRADSAGARTEAAAARTEAAAARKAAWAAEDRATEAEARATSAEVRAAAAEARAIAAETLVTEVRLLVSQHPNAETLLAQIEALQRQRSRRAT